MIWCDGIVDSVGGIWYDAVVVAPPAWPPASSRHGERIAATPVACFRCFRFAFFFADRISKQKTKKAFCYFLRPNQKRKRNRTEPNQTSNKPNRNQGDRLETDWTGDKRAVPMGQSEEGKKVGSPSKIFPFSANPKKTSRKKTPTLQNDLTRFTWRLQERYFSSSYWMD